MRVTLALLTTLMSINSLPATASTTDTSFRLGISMSPVRPASTSLNLDLAPVFSNASSLGIELFNLRLLSVRGVIWSNPFYLSGFYGGAKLYTGFGSKIVLEPGIEVGWIHRFSNRFDLGVGMDFVLADVIGGTLKITGGYLF